MIKKNNIKLLLVCPEIDNKKKYGNANVVFDLKANFKKNNIKTDIFGKKYFLKKIFEIKKYNLIHLHGCWNLYYLYFFIIGKLFNIKTVISPHGMMDPKSIEIKSFKKKIAYHIYQKIIFNFSDSIIVNSIEEKKNLLNIGIKNKIHVINHGIQVQNKYFVKKNNTLKIVYYSRIHPIKGLKEFLLLWLSSKKLRKFKFDLYGNIDDEKYFNIINKIIKNNKNINYLGGLSSNNKLSKLSKYNLLIQPSTSESFGLTILEAISCGLFVLVSQKLPWHIIESYDIGYFFKKNRKDLEKKIFLLEKKVNNLKINKHKIKIRRIIKENYSWKKIISKYLSVYELVIR